LPGCASISARIGRPDITISGNDQTRIFKVAGDVRP
jgi:hypothetical protein